MPGIFGLLTRGPREIAERQLEAMLGTLRHESFYVAGTWMDESLGLYVGWVARQATFAADMPIRNETGEVTLIFSGEEYSDSGTITRLKQNGHKIEDTAASYLVHLYEEDPDFPSSLNGRFHGVIADRRSGRVTLFNDRIGMRRIYYHRGKEAFYFSSEAKAILKARPELRTIDPRALGELASCGCVMQDRTLFPGISILPGGSAWSFRQGELEADKTYFQPREWEQQPQLDLDSYYQELRTVFSRNLPRYFNGHERIGVSLTGGLDTRIIMAWRKPEPNSLPCYTYGGTYRECHDVRIAREVASLCGQPHQAIIVGDDFLRRFSRYAERSLYLTDGCVDLSRSPDLYVSEQARGIAPARMVGTFGSEILQQVPAFKPVQPLPGLFAEEVTPHIRRAEDTYRGLRAEHPATFSAFKQASWWHYGVVALEETQLTERTPFLDADFVRTVYRAPTSAATTNDVRLRLIHDGNHLLANIPTDRGENGNSAGLPRLFRRLVHEFSFKAEYAYDYGMPQWLARTDHALSLFHFEKLFIGRHKLFHFRIWYRDALAPYVQEVLLDHRALSRPYVQRKTVEDIVGSHVRGDRNYTTEIHKLLTLELIHRLFVDGN